MKHIYIAACFFTFTGVAVAQTTCATAVPITAGVHTEDTIMGTDVPDPICAANGNGATAGEWYTYTPTQDYTVTLTTDLAQNAGGDTRFHVYTGTCGALTCHSGDDDSGSGYLSVAQFTALQGTTYYIAFDNRWSSNGFDFEITEAPYTPPATPPVTFTPDVMNGLSGDYDICVVDMNGDYLDDIVTVYNNAVKINYQNMGGGFTEATYNVPNITYTPSWSLAAGDIDKNGFNDLLYGNGVGVQFMMADATGTDYTEIAGPEYVFSQRSNFIDLNNDGHLDAFVCHDVDPNVYYINDGSANLTFYQGGIGDHQEGGNYGSIWTDIDNDGDMDLFIAKCRGGQSTAKYNELHRNNGDGTFTDISTASNMYDPVQTWSSAWNDHDNDGDMDGVIGASSSADGTHKVMENDGSGNFTDATAGSGWDTNPTLNIEHISYDFDNDGNTDVLGGGGKIMYGNGDLTFNEVQYSLNNGPVGDLNNDGFLDVQNGSTIYYNSGNSNNWVKFNVQGIESNGNGIGSRVTIFGDFGQQIRDVRSGEGFRFMNTLNVHFGIGQSTGIDSVHVLWPNGTIDAIHNPAINQSHTIVQGSSPLGVPSLAEGMVSVYPNPTTDFVTIENFEALEDARIELISYSGKFIQEITEATTNVKELAQGRYIIRITAEGESFATSFVKK